MSPPLKYLFDSSNYFHKSQVPSQILHFSFILFECKKSLCPSLRNVMFGRHAYLLSFDCTPVKINILGHK